MKAGSKPQAGKGSPTGAMVIGWGHPLRGDDAAGHLVAERLEGLALPGVRVATARLLTPELAYDLSGHEVAVLIDADAEAGKVYSRPVEPSGEPRGTTTHSLTASQLLGLCEAAYGVRPKTWLVGVPAERFELGDEVSVRTRAAVEEAVTAVCDLLEARAGRLRESGASCVGQP